MSDVRAPRKTKSGRIKRKAALVTDGKEPVATQWTAVPFAQVKPDSRREAFPSKSELQTFFDTFPNEIEENDKLILKQIDEAWLKKDLDEMFHLIKVSD